MSDNSAGRTYAQDRPEQAREAYFGQFGITVFDDRWVEIIDTDREDIVHMKWDRAREIAAWILANVPEVAP